MAAAAKTEASVKRDYLPPGRRPKKGEKVHDREPDARNGQVVAVVRTPEMSDQKSEQFVFVVRWWTPSRRRFSWTCHTPFEWELGLVRPGPVRRGRKNK